MTVTSRMMDFWSTPEPKAMPRQPTLAVRSFILVPLVALLGAGCSGLTSPTEDTRDLLVHGLAAVATGDPRVPYVAAHETGDRLAVVAESGRLEGAVFMGRDGSRFTVFAGPDGLPDRAVTGETVILFSNWSSGSVDVAVVRPGGGIEVHRDVPLPEWAGVSGSASIGSPGVTAALDIGTALSYAGLAVATASCVTAIIASAGLALPCGAAVLSAVALAAQDVPGLEESAGAIGLVAGVAGCGGSDPFACAGVIVEGSRVAWNTAEAVLQAQDREVALAEDALASGGGDVQITLSWDTSADLDLWVTDPTGERIYFGNPSSNTGGELDRDDTDGFGPENVFWPRGQAPGGTYIVQVDHFSGTSPTNFDLLVQAFGYVKAYSGRVRSGRTNTVVTFTSGSPLPMAGVLVSNPRAKSSVQTGKTPAPQ